MKRWAAVFALIALAVPSGAAESYEGVFGPDDHCVAYRVVKDMLFSKNVVVVGLSCEVTASLVAAGEGVGPRFVVEVPIESFESGNGLRDSSVSDILGAKAQPDLRFSSEPIDVEELRREIGGTGFTIRACSPLPVWITPSRGLSSSSRSRGGVMSGACSRRASPTSAWRRPSLGRLDRPRPSGARSSRVHRSGEGRRSSRRRGSPALSHVAGASRTALREWDVGNPIRNRTRNDRGCSAATRSGFLPFDRYRDMVRHLGVVERALVPRDPWRAETSLAEGSRFDSRLRD